MALEHLRMLVNEFFKNYPDIVPEESPIIILDIKSAIYMANNGKDINHTRHFSRRVHFVRNDEKYKMQDIDWC